MGVNLKDLMVQKPIEFSELRGRTLAVDAFNTLYQFLSIIRQRDGTPLMDSHGNITSAYSGVFYRTLKLLEEGINPVWVFDGKPPEFKAVRVEREERKKRAEKEYAEALEKGDMERARTFAQQTSRLTEDIISESKELLSAMGVPTVQAPSEGEAQIAFMVRQGDAWAGASQDADTLLFGAERLVKNLSISGRRKLPGKQFWVTVKPQLVELQGLLSSLKITREQFIILAILVGTDFNPRGIKGVGPKKALALVQEHKKLKTVMQNVEWTFDIEPEKILDFFKNPPVTKEYDLKWQALDHERIKKVLVDKHEFSLERVEKRLARIEEKKRKGSQTSLSSF